MAIVNQVIGDLQVTGQVIMGDILPGIITRSDLVQDTGTFRIELTQWRVWDAFSQQLPGDGQVEAAVCDTSYYWDPNSADDSFFVAGRAYRVVGATARVEVVGTDGGAVTAVIKRANSGTD